MVCSGLSPKVMHLPILCFTSESHLELKEAVACCAELDASVERYLRGNWVTRGLKVACGSTDGSALLEQIEARILLLSAAFCTSPPRLITLTLKISYLFNPLR